MAYTTKQQTVWDTIQSSLDKYTTFTWNGYKMENFHCILANEKGSLKLFNGPSFTNEYTTPQYDASGSILSGVTVNKQQISFDVAVIDIDANLYRKLIYILNPFEVGYLSFDYDTKWKYFVKLSRVSETSDRYTTSGDRFMTFLTLTFDIQGEACAVGNEKTASPSSSTGSNKEIYFDNETDLDTSFRVNFTTKASTTSTTISIIGYKNSVQTLNVKLAEVCTRLSTSASYYYDSLTGNIYTEDGAEICSLLTVNEKGEKIFSSIAAKKYKLTGLFNTFTYDKYMIYVTNANRASISYIPKTTLI